MATTRIAAVMRSGAFSPNHIANDATILNTVAAQLRKRGCDVRIYSEDQLIANATQLDEPTIIGMCRERRSVEALQALEDSGRLVINSGFGIENCIRERQVRIFAAAGIPHPESIVVDTDEVVRQRLEALGMQQCWIKRGDFHSQHAEDVSYVRSASEAQDVLQEFFLRGFRRAVISRHLPGTLIKFYGVAGTDFFNWFMPFESDSLTATHAHLDSRLRDICSRAAHELNLVVYGGECILSPDGSSLDIIDFNDWPSFSACRQQAAIAITKAVTAAIKARKSAGPKQP